MGFLVPTLVLLVFNRVEGRRGAGWRLLAPLNLLVFFALTLPWFVGVCLRHHLGDTARLDHGEALQAQRREQRRVGLVAGQRARRNEVDLALDAPVEHEVALGEQAECLDHGGDVGIDEIERNLFVAADGRRIAGEGGGSEGEGGGERDEAERSERSHGVSSGSA